MKRYKEYSEKVTNIYERPDLHMALDLVFHSPLQFYFNNEFCRHGWLDVLILGDTRCGKGQAAESLCRYYGVGEVISSENSSFVGIIGGTPKITDRTFISWGKLVLNHGRLIVIDEASELDPSDISKMSRVRSEGIAEIDKGGFHHRTQAATRLIWISNTRSRRFLETYATGADALLELMDYRLEDIARFSYVLTVTQGEVPSRLINRKREKEKDWGPLEPQLDRWRLMWCWSRKPDQVRFGRRSVQRALTVTEELGHMLVPDVPLFQIENGRFKIASIAAAFAGACMSTDENYEYLFVTSAHVECARRLLLEFYQKPNMSFVQYSKLRIKRHTLHREEELEKLISSFGKSEYDFVCGMLDTNRITATTVASYGGIDMNYAKELIMRMVGFGALKQGNRGFYKKPAFIDYLKEKRTMMGREVLE
jgi:hypothetical protein